MIHLLAISVCDDYLLKLINQSNIEQSLDFEKDTDDNTKEKSLEFDDLDDKFLVNTNHNSVVHPFSQIQKNISNASFQYLHIALPQRINEILIPPPRV